MLFSRWGAGVGDTTTAVEYKARGKEGVFISCMAVVVWS